MIDDLRGFFFGLIVMALLGGGLVWAATPRARLVSTHDYILYPLSPKMVICMSDSLRNPCLPIPEGSFLLIPTEPEIHDLKTPLPKDEY